MMAKNYRTSNVELAKTLEAHKLWLESGGKSGARADLSRARLSDCDLRGADFSGAKFFPGWEIVRKEV